MRIALFPGTFDPITLGHTDIINRAMDLFDKIVIGIGKNSSKQPMFAIEQRIAWIESIYQDKQKVEVQTYQGLTVDFCNEVNARYILRGIRNIGDYEYEKSIADMNRALNYNVETVFLSCSSNLASHSSTIVRDIIKHHGNYELFVPSEVRI